tara:strand:- start:1046 stop:1528 length:483 start_codon:yes stop_codon:yes gene_type:complete
MNANESVLIIFAIFILSLGCQCLIIKSLLNENNNLSTINNESVHVVTETGPKVDVPVFNIPTQYMEAYRQIGILHTNGSILPLLGRKIHRGSSNWNYYTLTNDALPLKIPLVHKNKQCMDNFGCSELYDNDEVTIPEMNATYTIRLYNNDPYFYNPNIFQ